MRNIHELREKQVLKLASMEPSNNIAKAERLMNSFYRYAAFRDRFVEEDNCEETYFTRQHHYDEQREEAWYDRLNKAFSEYGLHIEFYGTAPTITDKSGHSAVIETYWYD